ncbi:unnamed protein product [Oreochromis niloticus]|nr:unnamed protein product [Mustela putorius furo]
MNYCKQCGRGFTTPSELREHELCHSEVKKQVCDQCGSSFITADHLEVHKRSHAVNKQFHCYQCAKTCTSLSALCKHQRDHAEPKSLDHNESEETERSSSGFRIILKNLEIRLHRVQMESPVKSVS